MCQSIEGFLFYFLWVENFWKYSFKLKTVYQWLSGVCVIDSAELFILILFVLFCWFFLFCALAKLEWTLQRQGSI